MIDLKAISVIPVFLLLPIYLWSQQLSDNRWKEVQRLDVKKDKVDFTDTLYINYSGGEQMELRKGGFAYKGKIEGKKLIIDPIQFDIVKNNDKEIRIKDHQYMHIFSRQERDNSASDAAGYLSINQIPEKTLEKIDSVALIGEWEAYKRLNRDGPTKDIDYKKLIKRINFHEKDESGFIGYAYSSSTGEIPIFELLGISKGVISVKTNQGGGMEYFKILFQDERELIIEDDMRFIYYLKKNR